MEILKSFIQNFFVRRKVDQLEMKIARLQKEKENSDYEIEFHLNRLKELEKTLKDEVARSLVALTDARKLNERLEESLSATRDSLKTATDIVIPGLVSANDVFIKRWEAESRIHVMRAAISEVRSEGT